MLRCEMAHVAVFLQTHHFNRHHTPIPCHCEHLFKEGIANPDALPLCLDRESGFGPCWRGMKEAAQLYNSPQVPRDKCATRDAIVPKKVSGVSQDRLIARAAAKPCPPRLNIQPKKMLANIFLVGGTESTDHEVLWGSLIAHPSGLLLGRLVRASTLGRR